MALSKTTQDHDEIREWAEKRGGKPAEVAATEKNGQTGIIRLEFPDAPYANDSALKEISWDEFFEKFDASGLSLVYQEVTKEGAESNFNRFIHPDVKAPGKKAPAKKTAAGKSTPAKSASKAPAKKTASTAAKKTATKEPAKKAAATKGTASKSAPAKSTSKKSVTPTKTTPKKAASKKTR